MIGFQYCNHSWKQNSKCVWFLYSNLNTELTDLTVLMAQQSRCCEWGHVDGRIKVKKKIKEWRDVLVQKKKINSCSIRWVCPLNWCLENFGSTAYVRIFGNIQLSYLWQYQCVYNACCKVNLTSERSVLYVCCPPSGRNQSKVDMFIFVGARFQQTNMSFDPLNNFFTSFMPGVTDKTVLM